MGRLVREQSRAGFETCRCLIVEDDPLDRKAMVRLLSECGRAVDIDAVETVMEARQRLFSGTYDMVLTDHHLPDGFGGDFLTDCVASGVLRWSKAYLLTVMPEHAPATLRNAGHQVEIMDKSQLTPAELRRIISDVMTRSGAAK